MHEIYYFNKGRVGDRGRDNVLTEEKRKHDKSESTNSLAGRHIGQIL